MVSGLVTSPCDHDWIFSGDARLMRIASKSLVSAEGSWNEGRIYLHLLQHGLRSRFEGFLLRLDQFDVETEGLQLADEHVERFRQARRERRVALHDRFVDLRASGHVVRLRGEELLKDVRRAICFERPDLHFSKPLAAELRLAAERLLRDERVRSDRTRVDLLV